MSPGCVLFCVCLMGVLSNSRELPVESENPTQDITTESIEEHPSPSEDRGESFVPRNGSIERWNHSRMLLKITTLGYDDWWFLTSKRPFISYKDFPGISGVASWKEINPSESGKSPPPPTGASNEAPSRLAPEMLLLSLLLVLPVFCWV